MQATAIGQHRIHEWGTEIHASPGRLQHLLDQIAHLVLGQHGRGQLMHTSPRDEHLRRDPGGHGASVNSIVASDDNAIGNRILNLSAGQTLSVTGVPGTG